MTPSRLRLDLDGRDRRRGGARLARLVADLVPAAALGRRAARSPAPIAGGALLPLALASLALVAALALAGPFFRVVLGVLDALLGVCVVAVSVWALSDPVRASLPVLVDATGLTGDEQAFLDEIASTVTTAVAVRRAGGRRPDDPHRDSPSR